MRLLYKITRKLFSPRSSKSLSLLCTKFIFWGNRVKYSSFRTTGTPYVNTKRGGRIIIGNNFAMNNKMYGNVIGFNVPCSFVVNENCEIRIGYNVGISQTSLIAHADIIIGNNVKIGGGTCVYTSDFHSLNKEIRRSKEDFKNRKTASVHIEDDVFIGARCLVLKGVTIGNGSIIGAGSVVTKSIPPNEIWGGNPAKFIRKAN